MSQEEVRSLADYEIINDGKADVDAQLDHLLSDLQIQTDY